MLWTYMFIWPTGSFLIISLLVANSYKHTYNVTSMTGLRRGKRYVIQAKGPARCMYGDPFNFQVYPGDPDKLIVFFQGGGLCTDQNSILKGHCLPFGQPFHPLGMLDRRQQSTSKFRDYTLVLVEYCSGDALIGSIADPPYRGPAGQHIYQYGAINTLAVLDWIAMQQQQQQQQKGEERSGASAISSPLQDLVLLGSSAGCIGAYMWSSKFFQIISWRNSAVILDGILITLPPGYFTSFLQSYHACSFLQYYLSPAMLQRCYKREFSTSELIAETLNHNSDIPYVFLLSKNDIAAHTFYNNLGLKSHLLAHRSSGKFVFDMLSSQLTAISSKAAAGNMIVYLVDGDNHVFTNRDQYFTTDATKLMTAQQADNSDIITTATTQAAAPVGSLMNLLERFPLRVGETAYSVCVGRRIDEVRIKLHPAMGNSTEDREKRSKLLLNNCGEVNSSGDMLCFNKYAAGVAVELMEREQLRYCVEALANSKYTQIQHPAIGTATAAAA